MLLNNLKLHDIQVFSSSMQKYPSTQNINSKLVEEERGFLASSDSICLTIFSYRHGLTGVHESYPRPNEKKLYFMYFKIM